MMVVLFVIAPLFVDTPYSCSGTALCPSSCTSTTVSCSLSGTIDGSWSCNTQAGSSSIKCEVKNAQGTVISETTSHCSGCSGGGGSGGGSDPGAGGEFCDPIDPLWWIWCNPFPVI